MHGNEEERTNNIHLDFLKPLTVLHANFIKSRATVTLPILSRVGKQFKVKKENEVIRGHFYKRRNDSS